jgi:hypothetical protein
MSNIVTIVTDIYELNRGEYCSLTDSDGVSHVRVIYDSARVADLSCQLREAANAMGVDMLEAVVSDYFDVTFLDEDGNEVEPEYHRGNISTTVGSGWLNSGYGDFTVRTESKYDTSDFAELHHSVELEAKLA